MLLCILNADTGGGRERERTIMTPRSYRSILLRLRSSYYRFYYRSYLVNGTKNTLKEKRKREKETGIVVENNNRVV